MNRYVLSVIVTASLATGALAQQGPPGGLGVNVLNTPLAVTGSTTVSGAVAATQSGAWNVNVANPAALAAAIAQVLGIGTPVAFTLDLRHTSYSVAAGQRLAIEYVSGVCPPITGENIPRYDTLGPVFIVTTNAISNLHYLALPINSPPFSGFGTQYSDVNIGQLVKIYADPGTNVQLGNPLTQCSLTFAGRLIAP